MRALRNAKNFKSCKLTWLRLAEEAFGHYILGVQISGDANEHTIKFDTVCKGNLVLSYLLNSNTNT